MARVLIACEESQAVCKEFRKLGHEAYSCDLLPCSGGHPEWHIQGDVTPLLEERWDLVVAHPPCTRLCNSGVCWLSKRNLWSELKQSIKFFRLFVEYGQAGNRIAIENPIPHKYAINGFDGIQGIGKYSQIIQPWQFGHGETKATCLWLYNLPELQPTEIVGGREQRLHRLPPSADRSKLRSKTFPGIAKAFAEQYGKLL